MDFDFDTPVDRRNIGNMKDIILTQYASSNGLVMLYGAEMDFKTAPVIREALSNFAQRGIYGYTVQNQQYFRVISKWMKTMRKIDIGEDEIIPTLGIIHALNTTIRSFTNEGDGIILQPPVYHRYNGAILKNNRNVAINQLIEDGNKYLVDFADLEKLMKNPNNKVMILCNPHNPVGKVFDEKELIRIAELALDNDVIIFSDEIFAEISFLNFVHSYLSICPTNAIVATSLGKTFNFTGVSQANILIPNQSLRDKFLEQRLIDHYGSIDPFFHSAVLAAYSEDGQQWIEALKEYVWNNYLLIRKYVERHMPLLQIAELEGSFVIWINFKYLCLDENELEKFIINEAHILGDQGSEYGKGGRGHYRFNIATPQKRIKTFLENLRFAYKKRGF